MWLEVCEIPTLFDHETKDGFSYPEFRRRVGNPGRLFRLVGAISSLESSRLFAGCQKRYVAEAIIPLVGFLARSRWVLARHWHYCARDQQWPAQARREVGSMGAPDIDRHF